VSIAISTLVLLAAGCSDRSSPPPVGDTLRRDGSGAGDVGACAAGALTPVGRICVGGQGSSLTLVAGQPVAFHVYPKGCFSSSATKVRQAVCSVSTSSGTALQVDATFCLENLGCQQGCTADCSGGGFAQCASGALAAGSYTATLGGLSLSFAVPSTLTSQTQCAGDQF
jgi:hypothetical protein